VKKPEAYVLYAPSQDANGFAPGRVLCIKTQSGLAFIGFANADLAEEACIQLSVGEDVRVVELSAVGADSEPKAEVVVVIPDSAVLAQYMDDPGIFPSEKYFVPVA
jgi:hypothetical protein